MSKFYPGVINPGMQPKAKLLGAISEPYIPPAWLDSRSVCLEASFQGQSSECVLFTFCGQAEARNWKLNGVKKQLNPHPAYLEAKRHDGYPKEPGTTLQAGLDAMVAVGYLSAVAADSIRLIGTVEELIRCLHRYDVVATSWDATDCFYQPEPDGWIKPGGKMIGGHAMLACYWDEADTVQFNGKTYTGAIGCQNSYSETWGDRGFCRLPLDEARRLFRGGLVFDFLGS